MTYLQLINAVLRRLREDTVADLTATRTLQVGDFVNESKTWLENAWNWSALRDQIQVTTSASTAQYTLTGSGNRFSTEIVADATNNCVLRSKSVAWLKATNLQTTTSEGVPVYYIYDGVDASGDTKVSLYPTPGGTYTINFDVFQRTADLSTASETVLLPTQPLIDYAYALAAEERGDTGGGSEISLFMRAQRSIGDAIAHDNAFYTPNTDWYPN